MQELVQCSVTRECPTPDDPEMAAQILRKLMVRDGPPTIAILKGGRRLAVKNIAWGRDIGALFDHVTTNVSPPNDDPIDHLPPSWLP